MNADCRNHAIRKVTPLGTDWIVTTLAGKAGNIGKTDGTGNEVRFYFGDPGTGRGAGGVAVDSAGNLCVADLG